MIDGVSPFLCLRIRDPYLAYCERICVHRAAYITYSLLSTCARVLCVKFTCWFALVRTFWFVGLVDKNENPEDAALRELQEETGFIGKLSEVHNSPNVFCSANSIFPTTRTLGRVMNSNGCSLWKSTWTRCQTKVRISSWKKMKASRPWLCPFRSWVSLFNVDSRNFPYS